jgi:hypothetical protein
MKTVMTSLNSGFAAMMNTENNCVSSPRPSCVVYLCSDLNRPGQSSNIHLKGSDEPRPFMIMNKS